MDSHVRPRWITEVITCKLIIVFQKHVINSSGLPLQNKVYIASDYGNGQVYLYIVHRGTTHIIELIPRYMWHPFYAFYRDTYPNGKWNSLCSRRPWSSRNTIILLLLTSSSNAVTRRMVDCMSLVKLLISWFVFMSSCSTSESHCDWTEKTEEQRHHNSDCERNNTTYKQYTYTNWCTVGKHIKEAFMWLPVNDVINMCLH